MKQSAQLNRTDGAAASATRKIVLAGNPNVGKSVIFNALTGLNADVSNYPGTTIDIARGKLGADDLADTPGVYGVSSFNDEERAARKMILEAEIVVNIASALSLDRDLFLTLQMIEMGKRVLLVLNQWDEAIARKIKIDIEKLSGLLGVCVITCVAVEKQGIKDIIDNIDRARTGLVSDDITRVIQPMIEKGISQADAVLITEGDTVSATACGVEPRALLSYTYGCRRKLVNNIVEQCVSQESSAAGMSIRLGRFLLHPLWGGIISFLVCYFLFYQVLGVWVAGNLVDLTEKKGMKVYYEPNLRRLAAYIFPSTIDIDGQKFEFPSGTLNADKNTVEKMDAAFAKAPAKDAIGFNFWATHDLLSILGNVLVGEYGILTLTVTYLLALLMPLVIAFYAGLSILEDSGYLPRLAVLVDRLMNKIGLNGRAIIPLILGLGCVTMATITTRLLTTKREKIIATALLGVAIPCSAQLGVVSGVLAKSGGLAGWIVYGTVIFGMLAATGVALNMILPGQSGSLIIDLPPMRLPRADNVLKKTWKKSYNFIQEAIPMFFLAGFLVTIAEMIGLLNVIVKFLQPITVSWLGMPADPRIATTFILGIVRRDFASFGLTEVPMTAVQAVTAMIVITLFVPCIATVGVMIKERGMKIAMAIWAGSWIAAFALGGLAARALPFVFKMLGTQ